MVLSKTKYCNAIQCKKILWLDEHCKDEKEDVANQGVLDKGVEVGIFAKNYFGDYVDIEYNSNKSIMVNKTKELIDNNDSIIITEASFMYEDNFCAVDILLKNGDTYDIYEVKSSSEVKDINIHDVSYQYYVLKNLGLNINSVNLMHLNTKYVRNGDLVKEELFVIEDLTNIVKSNLDEVEKMIKDVNEYMLQDSEPNDDLGMNCFEPYKCPFFKHCTKHLDENNVFKLRKFNKKKMLDYYYRGKTSFEDLYHEDLNPNLIQQIEFELFQKDDYIDKLAIREFMNTLTYPLYFLDFETYQEVIPPFDGVSPYAQIPFQYSLHYVESIDGELMHKEFLAEPKKDPRRILAERLVEDIPMDVCTLAYNMGFEKGVIKKLASMYPDLSEHLMNIHDNIKDLMIPFIKRYYYTKDMKGSYSIKYVLPALFPNDPALDYHNLDEIHNGGEAMSAFAKLGDMPKEDQEKTRHNMLKYCELDTYAMVKIWEKLKSI